MKRIWFAVAATFIGLSGLFADDAGYARVRPTGGGAPIVKLDDSLPEIQAVNVDPVPIAVMAPPAQTPVAPYSAQSPVPHPSAYAPSACQGGCDSGCQHSSAPLATNSRVRFTDRIGLGRFAGTQSCSQCDGKYGIHPMFRKLFWWRKDCGCGEKPRVLGRFGGLLGANAAGLASVRGPIDNGTPPPGIGYPGTPGAGMPGTLVFPNHQYVRSPRDFFMQDPK